MRYLSLFSGIEACTVAWHPLGWEPVAFAEVDAFPSAVLAHHYPDVPNLGDVTRITPEQIAGLGPIDLVVGGSPCQDLSVAGKRAGLAGARSSLFFHQVRLFKAARRYCGARFLLWENVPGAFSSHKGGDFAKVVGAMAGLIDVDVPKNGWGKEGAAVGCRGMLEWGVLDAQWFGLAQRRKRVFALLDTGDWAGRPPLLLDPESLRGDSAPRRETGKNVAEDAGGGVAFGGNKQSGPIDVATAVNAHGGPHGRLDFESETFIACNEQHAVAFHGSQDPDPSGDVTRPLGRIQGQEVCVAFETRFARNGRGAPEEVCPPLKAQSGMTGKRDSAPCVAYDIHGTPATEVCRQTDVHTPLRSRTPGIAENSTTTIVAFDSGKPGQGYSAIRSGMQVRRLTPLECYRLQGFPDHYLDIEYRGRPAADGPKYKALGNSMAVNCMRWIGEQIELAVGLQL